MGKWLVANDVGTWITGPGWIKKEVLGSCWNFPAFTSVLCRIVPKRWPPSLSTGYFGSEVQDLNHRSCAISNQIIDEWFLIDHLLSFINHFMTQNASAYLPIYQSISVKSIWTSTGVFMYNIDFPRVFERRNSNKATRLLQPRRLISRCPTVQDATRKMGLVGALRFSEVVENHELPTSHHIIMKLIFANRVSMRRGITKRI